MSTKTQAEIDAEKAGKPRPDLLPPIAVMLGGRAMGVGERKHGLGRTGFGTYRDEGSEQADVRTHIASFERHWLKFKRAFRTGTPNPIDPESGDEQLTELACAIAQLAIVIELIEEPVDGGAHLASLMDAARGSSGRTAGIVADPWALPKDHGWVRGSVSWQINRHGGGFGYVFFDPASDEFAKCGEWSDELIELVRARNKAEPIK